eukprot:TRINITY_DN38766_c0_g1_i1.p3 TRINITY_DN38766_c0_g1~~TRINITY_DN38766_c0_g1_i1.p3  ORF type:complete len:117 (-),score=38.63 TRINITY_DN38766_c0_g1_i1:11-361(-)
MTIPPSFLDMNADLEQRAQVFADVIGRAMPADGLAQTAIPGLWLIRSSQPTEPLQVLHEPAVCIIAQGAKQVMLGDSSYAYDPAKYLVVSVDLPLSEIGRAVQQECRDRSRMPSSA